MEENLQSQKLKLWETRGQPLTGWSCSFGLSFHVSGESKGEINSSYLLKIPCLIFSGQVPQLWVWRASYSIPPVFFLGWMEGMRKRLGKDPLLLGVGPAAKQAQQDSLHWSHLLAPVGSQAWRTRSQLSISFWLRQEALLRGTCGTFAASALASNFPFH